jgi:hypothetical protein
MRVLADHPDLVVEFSAPWGRLDGDLEARERSR